MVQALKKKLKNDKGFTLIELLAVIVILGIIAAIAIPSINKVIQNSRVSSLQSDAIAVYNAAKLYNSQHEGTGPITQDQLTSGADAVLDNTKLTGIKVYVQNNGSLLLDADGTAGSVTVTIRHASYSELNDKTKWPSNGNITITGTSTVDNPGTSN
jgi:type IV pilus assembly protein PilA